MRVASCLALVCALPALGACAGGVSAEDTASAARGLSTDVAARGHVVARSSSVFLYLSFDVRNSQGVSTGLVGYANALNKFFQGRADCVHRSGNEVGISGVILQTNLASTSYFLVEARETTNPAAIRVRTSATPFSCDDLSNVYPGIITEGDFAISDL